MPDENLKLSNMTRIERKQVGVNIHISEEGVEIEPVYEDVIVKQKSFWQRHGRFYLITICLNLIACITISPLTFGLMVYLAMLNTASFFINSLFE